MANEIVVDKLLAGSIVGSGDNVGKDAVKTSDVIHNALINSVSTGIVSQFIVAIDTATTINLGGFKVIFAPNNHADGIATLPVQVDYAGNAALVITDVLTQDFTFVGIASNGALTQQATEFTDDQKATIEPICAVFHPNGVIVAAEPLFTPASNVANQLANVLSVFGSVNVSGNNIIKGTTNFSITKEVGETLRGGTNSVNFKSVNKRVNALIADAPIYYSFIDSAEPSGYRIEAAVTDIDLKKWDDGSDVLQTLTGTETSIQWGYYVPYLHVVIVEYGQRKYADFNEANVNIPTDISTHLRNPILNASALRLYLVGSAQATSLNDPEVLFRNTSGLTSTTGGDSATLRTSLDRLDKSATINASITNVINPVTSKFHVIKMDADLVALTFIQQPTIEGSEIVLFIDWDNTAGRAFTVNGAKFRTGVDIGIPNLNGLVNTRDYIHCIWNNKDLIYDIVGQVHRY